MFYKKPRTEKKNNKETGQVRGVCPTCKKKKCFNSTHERVKISGVYYHETCYKKNKKGLKFCQNL